MNSTATLLETSFKITPLPTSFVERVRATGRDDFGREVKATIANGGEPVRDELRRVAPGERIILCGYQAVALQSVFAEVGPIYICAETRNPAPLAADELPSGYFNRTFALRAYNTPDEIIDSTLVEPDDAHSQIKRLLARPDVSHLHARFAGHGCFACRIDRADG